jgi:hypothetical protein
MFNHYLQFICCVYCGLPERNGAHVCRTDILPSTPLASHGRPTHSKGSLESGKKILNKILRTGNSPNFIYVVCFLFTCTFPFFTMNSKQIYPEYFPSFLLFSKPNIFNVFVPRQKTFLQESFSIDIQYLFPR